jgi:hypothetical protein
MTDRTHLTLRVELDPHDGSIAGRVLGGGAIYRSFSGWMGLAAAIEDTLQDGAGPGRRSTRMRRPPGAHEPEAERPYRQGESCTACTRIGSGEK